MLSLMEGRSPDWGGGASEVDHWLPSARVICALDHIAEERGGPRKLRSDNGPGFLSQAFEDWAE